MFSSISVCLPVCSSFCPSFCWVLLPSLLRAAWFYVLHLWGKNKAMTHENSQVHNLFDVLRDLIEAPGLEIVRSKRQCQHCPGTCWGNPAFFWRVVGETPSWHSASMSGRLSHLTGPSNGWSLGPGGAHVLFDLVQGAREAMLCLWARAMLLAFLFCAGAQNTRELNNGTHPIFSFLKQKLGLVNHQRAWIQDPSSSLWSLCPKCY